MDFNWDEGGADSFFGLNEFGKESKTAEEEKTPKSVVQTTPPPATEKETEEDRKQAEIQALAKELGVTFYEASTILNLQKRGKI